MTLDLTLAALDDLASIWSYTLERWGPAQEERYLEQIWDKFETIMRDPSCFRPRNDLFPGCQVALEGRHMILFRVNRNRLQVVRVLHSAMDFKRHVSRATSPKRRRRKES